MSPARYELPGIVARISRTSRRPASLATLERISSSHYAAMREEVGEDNWKHNPAEALPGITMPATMISQAANNHLCA
jgi:hypothetical protein